MKVTGREFVNELNKKNINTDIFLAWHELLMKSDKELDDYLSGVKEYWFKYNPTNSICEIVYEPDLEDKNFYCKFKDVIVCLAN